MFIGMAQHPVADSTSPAHAGFQLWLGPKEGTDLLGAQGYLDYVKEHGEQEDEESYSKLGKGPANAINGGFSGILREVLEQ
jgi:hypothetical protein